jgi:hypothetical protein
LPSNRYSPRSCTFRINSRNAKQILVFVPSTHHLLAITIATLPSKEEGERWEEERLDLNETLRDLYNSQGQPGRAAVASRFLYALKLDIRSTCNELNLQEPELGPNPYSILYPYIADC